MKLPFIRGLLLLALIPALSWSQTVVGGEYFVDADPGAGSATVLDAADGNFDSSSENVEFTIDAASLPVGSHVVYVRMRDENGDWGRPKPASLYVISQDEGEIPTVASAEYFIDSDPGEGNATSISGDFNDTAAELEFDLETGDLPPGSHVVYVRMQDENGRWGYPKSTAVYIDPVSSGGVDPAIVGAEYFIDSDPGEGNAIALEPSDGSFDSASEIGEIDVSTNDLAPGEHTLYVRMQDENGRWGRPRGKFFQVRQEVDDSQAEFRIIAAEYFVDSDPGEGNATALEPSDGEFGGGFEDVAGQIETADLSVGKHTVSVRMQDQNGLWGRVRSIEFSVDPPPAEKPEMVVDDVGPHDFGTLKIDTRVEWTFTVSNASGAEDTLKVRSVAVDEPFSASIESFELAPGRSQRLTVDFFPTEEGSFNKTLVVRSNDVENPRLEIRLTGQGVPEQPQMVLSTPTNDHDFGAVRIGGGGEWTLVVANQGVDSLRVLEITTAAPFGASPSTFDVPPGGEQNVLVTYNPAEEGVHTGNLHIRTNDPNQRQVDVALTGEGVEFGVPVATVDTPADEQSGQVAINFHITDDDDSDVGIDFAYEVGGTRRAATVSGVGNSLTAAQYADLALSIIWNTDADLAGQDEMVRFVITVSDADHPAGKSALTADFRVDNNQPPSVQLFTPAELVGRTVEIPFKLGDAENDLLSLTGEYSTDGGSSWSPATIVSEITDISRYESSVLWDAFADLGYGRFSTRFRLNASDQDPGNPAEGQLQVSHLAADYDGDQQIDLDDLTRFLVAWNRLPKDATADIGPATGSVPDLVPIGDELLDFEDVVVLIQMWNWSVGVHPPAKLAVASLGPEVLHLETSSRGSHAQLDLQMTAGSLLAAGFELDYDASAWELIDIEPGDLFADSADLLLLKRELNPGQLVVQLGSLRTPSTTTGSLLRFHFAPRGRGRDEIHLSYDLRNGEGQRYAAGALTRRMRPVPEQYFLSANLPNPFNPGTLIPYGLAEESLVELTIYDILGRQVAQPVAQTLQRSGYYKIFWDGRDASGRQVGSGIYLYRLLARPASGGEPHVYTRRMLLLR